VGIFSNTGALLVSATVQSGPSIPFQDGFRLTNVSYTLQPGTYVIAGQRPSNADAAMVRASSIRTIPQITYIQEREVQSSEFVFPDVAFSMNEAGSFGPSFRVSDSANSARVITSIVNSGSFQGSFAAGIYMSIFGSNLAPGTRLWNASDFRGGNILPTSLDGVSVTVNGTAAYVQYISSGQVNVIVPDMAPATGVPVVIKYAGLPDVTSWVQIRDAAPAFFTWPTGTADAGRYAVAQHADSTNIGKLGLFPNLAARFTTPARPGETIVLYGTGFGPTTPVAPTGLIADKGYPLNPFPLATVGGRTATVAYAGIVASLSSVYQVNLVLPADLPDGDWPVVVNVGGTASAPVLLTVAR